MSECTHQMCTGASTGQELIRECLSLCPWDVGDGRKCCRSFVACPIEQLHNELVHLSGIAIGLMQLRQEEKQSVHISCLVFIAGCACPVERLHNEAVHRSGCGVSLMQLHTQGRYSVHSLHLITMPERPK